MNGLEKPGFLKKPGFWHREDTEFIGIRLKLTFRTQTVI